MKKTIYHIKELDLSTIRNNNLLSIAIMDKDVDRCAKTIRQYGLLTPLIVRPCSDGGYLIISGECELKALREVDEKTVEAVIVDCKDNIEADKLSLLLLSLKQDPTPLSEGLILQNLIKTGNYTQADIAYMVGKSISWVSKRLSMVERLHKSVLELVKTKKLSCHTAQEIARLPQNVQLKFATNVIMDHIPKSTVEKLVVAFNDPDILDSFKVNILENPREALTLLEQLMTEVKKIRKEKKETLDPNEKLYSSLRFLIKIISEIELKLAAFDNEVKPKKLSSYLTKAGQHAFRFSQLIKSGYETTNEK